MELVNEIKIGCYRILYANLSVPKDKRIPVLEGLDLMITRLDGLIAQMKQNRKINPVTLVMFKKELDSFVKDSFSETAYKDFNKKIVEDSVAPLAFKNDIVTAISMALTINSKTIQFHSRQTIQDYEHKRKWLSDARHCLKDFGLHPLIERRNKEKFSRYHVTIQTKSKDSPLEYRSLMDKATLIRLFVIPYQKKAAIQIKGVHIPFSKIHRLYIGSTLLLDEEIPQFYEKFRLRTELDFIKKSVDQTDFFLDQSYLKSEKGNPAKKRLKKKNAKEQGFIDHLILGLEELQSMDGELDFIKALKQNKLGQENKFRNWMKTWMKSHFKDASPEVPKGSGRIDLKVKDPKTGNHIVEFKGWWNRGKAMVVLQLYKYLTDFEKTGNIVIINHLSERIDTKYKNHITKEGTGYQSDSWKKLSHRSSDFQFYSSRHKIGTRTKTLYHFIYNLYP